MMAVIPKSSLNRFFLSEQFPASAQPDMEFVGDPCLNRFFLSEQFPAEATRDVRRELQGSLNRFFLSEQFPASEVDYDGVTYLIVSIASSSANSFRRV